MGSLKIKPQFENDLIEILFFAEEEEINMDSHADR
jgi:hypothetical protein